MTAKRRLIPDAELRRALDTLKEYGVAIGAVDIRADGVTVYPTAATPGNEYDRWKAQDAGRA
ncbi:hypothetical protein [Croceicoccus sp. YJ47]|uniref:hypothetical protein n=1 Tax=Croceicoccus sp. YJ47 TaxID=2798724 RepID=UPI00192318C1|nr:hypothetical protein [Croceicoccus sp. YJ47]QQN73905.1 hypothetical protein JD971_14340 [Croceicoccus sp. YJ47]